MHFFCRGLSLSLPVLIVSLAACGAPSSKTASTGSLEDFECNDRTMAYTVIGGFAADEAGISIQCAETGAPSLTKWYLDGGDKQEKTFPLSGEQFDDVWAKVDSSGWRFLDKECNNPDATPSDPVYSMTVGDHAQSVDLSCTGKTLPFPFDRIVNELDLRAVGFGDQGIAP